MDELGEGFDGFRAEVETAAGGGEEFGQGFAAAEGQGVLVLAKGFGVVAFGVGPDLQGAELGDAVFDVVEGIQEDVELAVPKVAAGVFVAGPIDFGAEAFHQAVPGGFSLRAGVVGVGVYPVLKGVHGGDPWKDFDDAFEVFAAGAFGVVRFIEGFKVFVAEEFHAHGGDLAKFCGGVAVGHEVFLARGQGVEGVAGFVEDGFDVALDTDCVHENEREAGFGESCLIATGGFAFAVGEVEEF